MPRRLTLRDLAMAGVLAYFLPRRHYLLQPCDNTRPEPNRVVKNPQAADDWRRDLRAKIVWALAAKLLGLFLLWFFFFKRHGP
jgi:hypothetical protein